MTPPEPRTRPPTGIPKVDALEGHPHLDLGAYVSAASEYVRTSDSYTTGQKKAAQIRLSDALGQILANELRASLGATAGEIHAGERTFSGALRRARLDVSEFHPLDGLRLAVELKPVNLAVGRAIWNRFGDIRMTAVNVHLKFPFAVAAGLLTVPTYELKDGTGKTTVHLITRAIDRFERAGSRVTESDAAHLLEAVGMVIYDPDSDELDPALPPTESPLRWDNFVASIVRSYDTRFGAAPSGDS